MSAPLLSAKLIELRQQHNYSQQEIADYLGLSREGYCHYERSVREPSLESLVRLSALYKIDISELINEKTILVSETTSELQAFKNENYLVGAFAKGTPSLLTDNLMHFLRLFSGKNTDLDLTDISKDDIRLLAQYKQLNKNDQKEVRQFIKFKLSLSKKKK